MNPLPVYLMFDFTCCSSGENVDTLGSSCNGRVGWLSLSLKRLHLVTEEKNLEDHDNHSQQCDGDHGNGDPHVIQEHLKSIIKIIQFNVFTIIHYLSLLGPHNRIVLLLGDTLHLVRQ